MILRWLLGRTRKAVNVVKDLKRFSCNSWDFGIFGWIFDEDGKLLLVENSGGDYALPGGGVERADTVDYKKANADFPFLESLRREVREETRIEIISVDPSTQYQLLRRGWILGNVADFVLVENYKGKVKESGIEIKNTSFFSKSEAEDKLRGRMKKAAKKAFKIYEKREG